MKTAITDYGLRMTSTITMMVEVIFVVDAVILSPYK